MTDEEIICEFLSRVQKPIWVRSVAAEEAQDFYGSNMLEVTVHVKKSCDVSGEELSEFKMQLHAIINGLETNRWLYTRFVTV
jgi:hypothetical protein